MFDQVVQHAQSHDVLKSIAYPSMGTHVVDIPQKLVETCGGSSAGNDETFRFIRDEINHLEGMIQTSLPIRSVLDVRLRSLPGEDDPVIDPAASDSEAEASHE
ncbi:hypothetical protein LIER_29229 [Lithospermum erythrorhizon]|uniref:Uncharacterized protein n=1 Tax=Lithospermum erythrorhizon TaxID=34254 RepID=A0AAV3RLH0_LITER